MAYLKNKDGQIVQVSTADSKTLLASKTLGFEKPSAAEIKAYNEKRKEAREAAQTAAAVVVEEIKPKKKISLDDLVDAQTDALQKIIESLYKGKGSFSDDVPEELFTELLGKEEDEVKEALDPYFVYNASVLAAANENNQGGSSEQNGDEILDTVGKGK